MAMETPYVETEVLLAVLNQDYGRARELLADMHRTEVIIFSGQIETLDGLVDQALEDKAL